MDKKIFNILPSESNTSKIIQIKGQYVAEVNNNKVNEFLLSMERSLSREVKTLKARLQSLENQINMYHD